MTRWGRSHLSEVGHLTVIGKVAQHVHAREAHAQHIVSAKAGCIAIAIGATLLIGLLLLLLSVLLLCLLCSKGGGSGVIRAKLGGDAVSGGLSIN